MKRLAFLLVICGAASAQTFSIQVGSEPSEGVTVSLEAILSTTLFIRSIAVPTAEPVTLAGSINNSATSVTISSAAGLKTGMGIVMDSEVALITAINSNTLTVARATLGTAAASHTSGITVTFLRSGSYSAFFADVISDTIRNTMLSTPGPGVLAANAAIASQQSTISGLQAAGVTHVP